MRKKFHVKKGDTVLVLSGESKGKRGTVLKVITDKDRAVVEGVNIITKHIKPTAGRPQGEKNSDRRYDTHLKPDAYRT